MTGAIEALEAEAESDVITDPFGYEGERAWLDRELAAIAAHAIEYRNQVRSSDEIGKCPWWLLGLGSFVELYSARTGARPDGRPIWRVVNIYSRAQVDG